MAKNIINGVTYEGNSISITNGRVFVDGKEVTPDGKTITIEVQGNIEFLKADACYMIAVTGECGKVETASGDVKCGNVKSYVKTLSGDVECGDVGDDVETMSGDVECGTVAGNVKTFSGDIKYKK